jgi:hypothetical protein
MYNPPQKQSMGLKYMPFQMQDYGIHLHLKLMLAGKQLEEACSVSNITYDMVMHVAPTIANSCRNVIMDNWFPNTQLATDLLAIK